MIYLNYPKLLTCICTVVMVEAETLTTQTTKSNHQSQARCEPHTQLIFILIRLYLISVLPTSSNITLSHVSAPTQPWWILTWPVLEEGLQSFANGIFFLQGEEVFKLLAEGTAVHADAGRKDLGHPLQGAEGRGAWARDGGGLLRLWIWERIIYRALFHH